MDAKKEFLAPVDLLRDSFALARRIYDSGYRPDVLLALWRGGASVGVVLHEFFSYMKLDMYHSVVKAASYSGIGLQGDVVVEHIEPVLNAITPGCSVLVVDDIIDTGKTAIKVRELLSGKTDDIRIAALYYKPDSSESGLVPDYFLKKTDKWIVFPHELIGLSPEEIEKKDGVISELLNTG